MTSIGNSSELLLTVINDVLDFSRIGSGRLDIERTRVDVRQVVGSALDIAAPLAAAKGLDLVCLVDEGVPTTVVTDGRCNRCWSSC